MENIAWKSQAGIVPSLFECLIAQFEKEIRKCQEQGLSLTVTVSSIIMRVIENIAKAKRGFFIMKGNIMLDSFDKGWFVLQTYSGYENKVKENLLQRAQTYNMLDNILRVEIPTQTVNVEKNGQTKEIEENRFPGYVLVEMVMTDEAWFVVRNTPNVTGFVGSHGNRSKPTPLLEEEIRAILLSMGQTIDVFDTNIKEGDVVQIIDGAFMGQEGRVVEIENNKVKLMLNMFGSETVAEVELYQIAEL